MKYILLFLALAICGCVSSSGLTGGDNVWIANTTNVFGFISTDYYYCVSNASSDKNNPKPVCYEALMFNPYRNSSRESVPAK
jgi:hypothetical protein